MLWYRRRTQPDWMRISGREFRHRLGCDTRCTAAAMCSIHVAVSLHVLWDTEDAWKEEIQNPTFFLYKHPYYLSHLFTSVSRCSSTFSSKPGWLDQIAVLPHSCNLGYTVVIVTGPLWWARWWCQKNGVVFLNVVLCTYKYTIYHRDLTTILLKPNYPINNCYLRRSYMRLPAFFYYYHYFSRRQITHITKTQQYTKHPPSFLFPTDFSPTIIPVALIIVFGDFRHPFSNFSSHQLFSRFPAFFSIGRGCRWDSPLQTGSLRIRCSLPQVSLSKLTFSPLRASPSLPLHPVPVWMVENIPTLSTPLR